jgi:saccharopine dehydrogenase-like NADP-dependent oxidoreductase
MKKAILVIGAAGELGRLISKEIIDNYRLEWSLYIGDYKSERGKQLATEYGGTFSLIDLDNRKHMIILLQKIDAVIVAIKQKKPIIQQYCFEANTLCVDVTAFSSFTNKVEEVFKDYTQTQATSIIMAGFFPGLSGLLLNQLVDELDKVEEANISLVQNISATAGITGMMDMFKIIHEPTYMFIDDEKKHIKGFTRKHVIKPHQANKKYTVRLIHHSEKEQLMRDFDLKRTNYWTSWNNLFFNKIIYLLNRSKWFAKWIEKPSHPILKKIRKNYRPKNETVYLIVSVQGIKNGIEKKIEWHVQAFSDYGLTARMTTAVTHLALRQNRIGVFHPYQLFKWRDLSPNLIRNDVKVSKLVD